MPHYRIAYETEDGKTSTIKNAPSINEAESMLKSEIPDAIIIDVGRVANAGENQQPVPRLYK